MSGMISRRAFVAGAVAAFPGLALVQRPAADPWARADAIVGGIRVPRFASRDFPITKYGDSRTALRAVAEGAAEWSCRPAGF